MSVSVSCVYVFMYQANELHLSILWNAVHTRKINLVYSKVYSLHNLPHYYLHAALFNGLQLEDIYQPSSHYPVTSGKPLFQASYNFFCSSLQRSLTWLCIYASMEIVSQYILKQHYLYSQIQIMIIVIIITPFFWRQSLSTISQD